MHAVHEHVCNVWWCDVWLCNVAGGPGRAGQSINQSSDLIINYQSIIIIMQAHHRAIIIIINLINHHQSIINLIQQARQVGHRRCAYGLIQSITIANLPINNQQYHGAATIITGTGAINLRQSQATIINDLIWYNLALSRSTQYTIITDNQQIIWQSQRCRRHQSS